MLQAVIPDNEDARLQKLKELKILDTIEEQAYDDLTRIAAEICQTPIALVSLIDHDRQWFKSHYGLDIREAPREFSFCAHAILGDDVFVIEDTTQDERFFDNPLVTNESSMKFYAGAPLIMSDNKKLGTLCVVGHEARTISETQKELLAALARQVVSQLELRLNIEELKKSKAEAERANQAKSAFLSSMSHELRTPLNAILGFGQLLEFDKAILSDSQMESVEHILEGGHHLLHLVNEVLDLAKIASGKIEVVIETFPLQNVIKQCMSLMSELAEKSNIKADYGNAAGHIIRADFMRLKQVLLNLISNAIKYNRPDGTVSLGYEVVENNRLRITVNDTGYGLTEVQLTKLFKPFSRVGENTANIEGCGIGLVISKELITLMKGTIGVASIVGKGSSFWFEIDLE